MKQFFAVVLAISLIIGFAACSEKEKQPEEATPSSVEDTQEIPTEVPMEETPAFSEPIYIADAGLYRGTLVQLAEDSIMLEQAEGRDYGRPQLQIVVTDSTTFSFDQNTLAIGDYIEVYYGTLGGTLPESVEALGINHLGSSDSRVLNGEILSISTDPNDPQQGSITLIDLKTEEEVVVNYNDDGTTQFYLNKDSLEPGMKLSIFHQPMMSASIPPQVFAEEVTIYYSGIEQG